MARWVRFGVQSVVVVVAWVLAACDVGVVEPMTLPAEEPPRWMEGWSDAGPVEMETWRDSGGPSAHQEDEQDAGAPNDVGHMAEQDAAAVVIDDLQVDDTHEDAGLPGETTDQGSNPAGEPEETNVSGDDAGVEEGDTTDDDAEHESDDVVDPMDGSVLVGPEGGVVTHASGASLDIPAGALSGPVRITMTTEPSHALPDGFEHVGDTIRLEPDGLVFETPATLRVPFAPEQLPADADPFEVSVYVTAPTDAEPGFLVGGVDPNGTVDVLLSHFSFYTPVSGRRTIASGPDGFETCALACPAGHHVAGYGGYTCAPGVAWRTTICRLDAGDSFVACQLGCPAGYYATPNNGVLGCPVRLQCSRLRDETYETCEYGCRSGYYRSGGDTTLACGRTPGSTCVSLTGVNEYQTCGEFGCRPGYTAIADPLGCTGGWPRSHCIADARGTVFGSQVIGISRSAQSNVLDGSSANVNPFPDGWADPALDILVSGDVINLYCVGAPYQRFWDTIVDERVPPPVLGWPGGGNGTWGIGVYSGAVRLNRADGTIPALGPGTHALTLSMPTLSQGEVIYIAAELGDGTVIRSASMTW